MAARNGKIFKDKGGFVGAVASENGVVAPNVSYVLPEVSEMMPRWELVADCLIGDSKIKERGTHYLPMPNAADQSDENIARYGLYKGRAVFYNVVANTVSGLVGQVFNADPVSEYPPELEPMWYDVDGKGVTLIQQAKKSLTAVISKGRCGLLVDFPPAAKDDVGNVRAFSRQEVMDGVARPTIQFYAAPNIINWRFKQLGAKSVLSLVVLTEDYTIRDDGFEIVRGTECRVLRLTDTNVYEVETWRRPDEKQEQAYEKVSTTIPTDSTGKPFGYIPFYFVGAQNNDANIDKPPMYDMAVLNIAHYQNMADYQYSVYMVGQPTPYFSGLTQNWVDEVLKGVIQLGSAGAVPLPEGGQAGLLQATENSMVLGSMEKLEKQMVALGAQLVEDKQVQRTLGEAKMEQAVIASTLTSCARNVSQAIEYCLVTAATFSGVEVNPDNIIFQLSTDFAIAKLPPQDRQQLLSEWQGGLLAWSEARSQLRQSGIATLDDEVAKAEIEKEQQEQIDLATEDPNDPPSDKKPTE